MPFKKCLICITAIGFLFGCGEQLDDNENFPSPNLSENENFSPDISDLVIYEIQTQPDFEEVLSISDHLNKPVLLYFTGYGSVNSRKFENSVWPDPEVYALLNDRFIIAQIYVDSRIPLDHDENLPDSMNTIGAYWMNYQNVNYGQESHQPLFDILNHKNESLVKGVATSRSHGEVDLYKEWLEEGLRSYRIQDDLSARLDENPSNDLAGLQKYQIQTEADFGRVLALSSSLEKPILLHFTGYASYSSRPVETKIWPDPNVHQLLKNEFLIASVYADDRTVFPEVHIEDSIATYGKYWMNYEIARYNRVTQPIFDIVDFRNESMVDEIATYRSHGTAELYREWLMSGMTNFKKE